MDKESKQRTPTEIKQFAGQRMQQCRKEGLKASRKEFGEQVRPEPLAPERIVTLEQGKGSSTAIYMVLKHLYDQGVNINYLFGEHEARWRSKEGAMVYAENVVDYLNEMTLLTGQASAQLQEMLISTKGIKNHIDQLIEVQVDEDEVTTEDSHLEPS